MSTEPKPIDFNAAGRSALNFEAVFDTAEAASELAPLSPGTYVARTLEGGMTTSRTKGTPGYLLTFEVLEGEHTGRRLYMTFWLTPSAAPRARRDLAKVGVLSSADLKVPLKACYRCKLRVAERMSEADPGTTYNSVSRFEVLGVIADPHADPDFAPKAGGGA